MSEELNGMALPFVSVIIPTYNRKDSLLRTLESLSQQSYPHDRFEVIVVDDGGSDGTDQITQVAYPFNLHYLRQANQGSAAARNNGAVQSRGDILLFIDDDMTLDAPYLAAIVAQTAPGVVTMGLWQPYQPANATPFNRSVARRTEIMAAHAPPVEQAPFTECTSNNLAVQRQDFFRVGMWQDVLGDGPTLWGDVEFGYRAWKGGCRFLRIAEAGIIHRDSHIVDLATACRRACHVSQIVQPLFALHPEIKSVLPMFRDKGPIAWRQDPPSLILRKLVRQIASSRPVMGAMERSVPILEHRAPDAKLLALFYRWIISGYIYRGYRDGLRQLAEQKTQ